MTVLFSRVDATKENGDQDWLKLVGGLLQANFPERLHKAIVGPMPMWARAIWGVVKYFFDPVTRGKVELWGGIDGFSSAVAAENLHASLGGSSEAEFSVSELFAPDVMQRLEAERAAKRSPAKAVATGNASAGK